MPDSQITALAVSTETVRTPVTGIFQSVFAPAAKTLVRSGVYAGTWAGEIAQKFGSLVSDLMGPAVFTLYSFAAWSLATNVGLTDTFVFTSGPLANWLIWLGGAILLNVAASILKRHVQGE
jgi:hypothetical protein